MEKITTKRTIIKTIEEEVEMDIYISKDGTVFDAENDCLKNDELIDFLSYFEKTYNLKNIEPNEYGLNYGHVIYCNLIYINEINDRVMNDFIRYYKLEDYPDDLIKIKEGWSFIALISDVNLWIFNKTDRKFIVDSLNDIIKNKKNELKLLLKI